MTEPPAIIRQYHQIPCPLCGEQKANVRFPATARRAPPTAQQFVCTNSSLAQHGDLVECQTCGMVYNNPQPDAEELLTIYRQVRDPRYIEEERGRELTFTRSLQQLQAYCQPPGKLLDIGCYTGTFLKIAAANGWTVAGSELSAWAAKIARQAGIGQVYEGHVAQIPCPPRAFDVITLWDVIEHLSAPLHVLEHTAHLLEHGGLLALSTYLIDSLPARLLGTRYPFFMDMHLVHFSRRTLRQMLARAGYEILAITPHYRVITAGYFAEKFAALLPGGKRFFHPLFQRMPVGFQNWHITIRWTGLFNIFARLLTGG